MIVFGGGAMKIKLVSNANILLVLVSLLIPELNAIAKSHSGVQRNEEVPRNVELTNAAWDAFKQHKYEDAIVAAERCAQRFKAEADRTQLELEQKKAKPLPTGKV